jgi:hypothetical protein
MMSARQTRLEALRSLRERETGSRYGWALDTDGDAVTSRGKRSVQDLVGEGLAELADREVRAELSAREGRAVVWAARLTGHGHDVLAYHQASPAPAPHTSPPAGEQAVELSPAQMDALRLYVNPGPAWSVPPAEGLAERVRTALFDRSGNRWRLYLTREQIESAAYAFHLRALTGSVAEANRFAREYDIAYRTDPATGRPSAVTMPWGSPSAAASLPGSPR